MKQPRFTSIFFLAVLLITYSMGTSGCAGAGSATPASQFPTGTYMNQSSRYGLELQVLDDSAYTTSSPETLIPVQGTYVVTKDQVVFTETKDGHCVDIPGTYKWKFDGKALTFTVVEDQCSLRRIALQSGPWVKQP